MAIFGNKKNEATKKKTAAPAKKAAPKSAPKSAPKKATVKKEAAPASMKDLLASRPRNRQGCCEEGRPSFLFAFWSAARHGKGGRSWRFE
jgi:hypothetical protein